MWDRRVWSGAHDWGKELGETIRASHKVITLKILKDLKEFLFIGEVYNER